MSYPLQCILFFIWILFALSSAKRISTYHQPLETRQLLRWIIEVNSTVLTENSANWIEQFEQETTLKYHSHFEHLPNLYLFEYFLPKDEHVVKCQQVATKFCHFYHNQLNDEQYAAILQRIEEKINEYSYVIHFAQETVRPRTKRSFHFNDPLYPEQWHLNNSFGNLDLNVSVVWNEWNITGQGVTVAVVDDGIEWNHTDLYANYSPEGSIDLNSEDADPMVRHQGDNNHGTRCAGVIAAVANSVCGVGVAFRAKVSGIRLLDGEVTDSLEARAFNHRNDVNAIYSLSWGPSDDGAAMDGPNWIALKALHHGVLSGRNGLGSIFVVASGNGGRFDNCNMDGYANSIYTLTIGAVDDRGRMPSFGEPCAAMFAVALSGQGGALGRGVVTTDWYGECTRSYSGTSAAAPQASALVALVLEQRHCLSWRDVFWIIVLTAREIRVENDEELWWTNAAGLSHSHEHGFGLMDAAKMVTLAKYWEPVAWMTSVSEESTASKTASQNRGLTDSVFISEEATRRFGVWSTEQIQVIVTIEYHGWRGELDIQLLCPSQTPSILVNRRQNDNSTDGFHGWIFNTVRCWGEVPFGKYQLNIQSHATGVMPVLTLREWKVVVYGLPMTSEQVADRKKMAEDAFAGVVMNASQSCPPTEQVISDSRISDRLLKFVLWVGGFLTICGIYQSIEYACCYNDEKKKQLKLSRKRVIFEETGSLLMLSASDRQSSHGTIATDSEESALVATPHE